MGRLALALIAHNAKKDDMIRLVRAHQRELAGLNLVATRGTGQLIQSEVGLSATLMGSGPLGGDQQIGALVASGEVRAVIFLRDPLMAQPHEPDISALLRICDVYNVPLATNMATAEAILHHLFEYSEAVGGHHLAAEFTEEMVAAHE
ncbi:methylglyoxal synthase [Dehalococcoidia bacterium]|nr:methylglyoxal synthase [Dehalococcoidia bacterium]MCL0090935.1 methylglyoxal synthase [Dehalococcoidia bacterium]MCL0104239.1 methylglyoxal synthase [Dehalococcoidia bacterium]